MRWADPLQTVFLAAAPVAAFAFLISWLPPQAQAARRMPLAIQARRWRAERPSEHEAELDVHFMMHARDCKYEDAAKQGHDQGVRKRPDAPATAANSHL